MFEPENISLASVIEWDCFKVLAYFSYFKYPLTAFEVWKWQYKPEGKWSLEEVIRTLATSTWLRERMSEKNGFFALGEEVEGWLADRHERFLDALRKYEVLRQAMMFIGRVPGVEAVLVGNSLAWQHTNVESDIDLFIVTEPKRVWSVRLLTVAMMAALRKRPGEAKIDPICCSFFTDSNHLDLADLKIEGADEEDPYLAFWIRSLIPVVDRKGVQGRLEVMNRWVGEALPAAWGVERAARWRLRPKKCWPRLGLSSITENWAKQLQEKKFPRIIQEMKNRDTRVVVNDNMLKFHENDRRSTIKQFLTDALC